MEPTGSYFPPPKSSSHVIDFSSARGFAEDLKYHILAERAAVDSLVAENKALRQKLKDAEMFHPATLRKVLVLEQRMAGLENIVKALTEKEKDNGYNEKSGNECDDNRVGRWEKNIAAVAKSGVGHEKAGVGVQTVDAKAKGKDGEKVAIKKETMDLQSQRC